MITFYLIRHGAKEQIHGDPTLTEVGIKQAEITGTYLSDKNINLIISSPLKRTLQTASLINERLQVPLSTDTRLTERMNWGDKKDETFAEFIEEWQKTDSDRNYKPSHVKSSSENGNGLRSLVDELSLKNESATILIVTHGGTIGDFLRNEFNENELELAVNSKFQTRYVDISECSITIVEKEKNKYRLKEFGSTHHLPTPIT